MRNFDPQDREPWDPWWDDDDYIDGDNEEWGIINEFPYYEGNDDEDNWEGNTDEEW